MQPLLPKRWQGLSRQRISYIFRTTLLHIYQRIHERIHIDMSYFGNTERVIRNSTASRTYIRRPHCFFCGYIDGTGIKICHPTTNPSVYYSEHHKRFEIRFLCIVNCEGLCVACLGPHIGSFSDRQIVLHENFERTAIELLRDPCVNLGEHIWLYGDAGFTLSRNICTPFRAV